MNILIFLLALAAPLLLLPLETVWPYPHILEEIVKAILVMGLLKGENRGSRPNYSDAIILGVLFTLSETILYLNNFLMLGNGSRLLGRLFLTGGLHLGTTLLLYAAWRRGTVWGIAGLLLAIAIHFVFLIFNWVCAFDLI